MPQIELNSACQQSLYKQLSQNVSDSEEDDSEDEVVRFQSLPRSGGIPSTALYSPTAPQLDNHPILVTPRTEQMYLDHAAAGGGGGRGGVVSGRNILLDMNGSTSDTMAILNDGGINSTNLQDDESAPGHIMGSRKPMGTCRKICFCLSIFVCFASVVIFLWGLPCHSDLTCPVRNQRGSDGAGSRDDEDTSSSRHNWIRNFEKVEFKGVISVTTNGAEGYGKNVIFLYRGDRIFEKTSEAQQHTNGILGVVGSGGEISWYDKMLDEPSSIDCGILDTDKDGYPDCLVIDEYGQLGCINPIAGTWLWHISLYQNNNQDNGSSSSSSAEKADHRRKAIDLLDFPLILPDVDGDGVKDLLLVTSLEQADHNNFLFVSGAHGRPLGTAYKLSYCSQVHKLKIEAKFKLVFNCIKNDMEEARFVSIFELFKLSTGKELKLSKEQLEEPIEQHKFYGQRKNTQNQRNIYVNFGAQLIVENLGKCPLNCTMTMSVAVDKGDPVTIIQGGGMYGMVPAALRTKKKRDAKEQLSGYVIKFWEWVDEGTSDKEQDASNNNSVRRTKRDAAPSQNVNWTFVKKERWEGPMPGEKRPKRQAAVAANEDAELVRRNLKEHVVLIMFNGTNHKVINTSQSDVIQFCRRDICQPDMNYQENSVTISDLDEEGFNLDQELISFYSTFVEETDAEWKLVTYVQSFRLEQELTSFYNT